MTVPKTSLRLALEADQPRSALQRLQAGEIADTIGALKAGLPGLQKGNLVVFLSGSRFLPFTGVVIATTTDAFRVQVPDQSEIITLTTSGNPILADGTIIPGVQMLPYGEPNPRDAQRLIRNLGYSSVHSYWSEHENENAGLITEFVKPAISLALDLGHPYPGAVTEEGWKNQALRPLICDLPGNDDDMNGRDQGPDWDVHENYSKDLDLKTWTEAKTLLRTEGLQVYDFFFGLTGSSIDCPYCAGTGISRAYDHHYKTFYSLEDGNKGWGYNLTQDEVDFLYAHDKLRDFTHSYITTPSELMTADELIARTHITADRLVHISPEAGRHSQDIIRVGDLYQMKRGSLRNKDAAPVLAETINQATRDRHSGKRISWMGHDSSNVHMLSKYRLERQGLSSDQCAQCDGHEHLMVGDEQLRLAIWAGYPGSAYYVIISVDNVGLDETADISAIMAQEFGRLQDHLLAIKAGATLPVNAEISEAPLPDDRDNYASDAIFPNWQAWEDEMTDTHVEANPVCDYAFSSQAVDVSNPALIAGGTLRLHLARPAKTAMRNVYIQNVTEADRARIVSWIDKSLDFHRSNFAWAVQSKPAQIAAE